MKINLDLYKQQPIYPHTHRIDSLISIYKEMEIMGIRNPNCKVLRHEATLQIEQGAGAFTYFTDLTENHYKAMMNLNISHGIGGPLTDAQLIVRSRTGTNTVIDLPARGDTASAVIHIEDAESVTLNYTATHRIQGSMHIVKDFCICCPDFSEVHRHEGTFTFDRDFFFTDLTENHYKAMVVVQGQARRATGSQGQVVVTPRTGAATTIALPPAGQSALQIEDIQSLSLVADAAPQGSRNTVQVMKDFCIRCP